MTQKKPHLEKDLASLEKLIEKLQSGDIELDQALKHFEQGVGLIKQCQQSLSSAEQKVKMLVDNQLQDFSHDGNDD